VQDLDPLQIERLDERIGEDAEIQQPQGIEILIRQKPPDVDIVGPRIGAGHFASCARRIADGLRDALRGLRLNLVLRDDGDRRRRFDQRRIGLCRGAAAGCHIAVNVAKSRFGSGRLSGRGAWRLPRRASASVDAAPRGASTGRRRGLRRAQLRRTLHDDRIERGGASGSLCDRM
jgi:hypothetical protein